MVVGRGALVYFSGPKFPPSFFTCQGVPFLFERFSLLSQRFERFGKKKILAYLLIFIAFLKKQAKDDQERFRRVPFPVPGPPCYSSSEMPAK